MGPKLGHGAFAQVHKCTEKVRIGDGCANSSGACGPAHSTNQPPVHLPISTDQATKVPAAVKVFDFKTAAPMVRERVRSSVLEEVRVRL